MHIQIAPFNAYGMYSDVNVDDDFVVFEIYLDGSLFDYKAKLPYSARDYINNSLIYFNKTKNNEFISPSESFVHDHRKIPSTIKSYSYILFPSVDSNKYFHVWFRHYLNKWVEFEELEVKVIKLKHKNNTYIFSERSKLF